MSEYRKLYTLLFNAMTDALADLDHMNFGAARERLVAAQRQAEEQYIAHGEQQSSAQEERA